MGENARLTILHVLDDLETGGSERQLTAFLLRSDTGRFRHVVCVLSEAGRFGTELREAGIPIHVLRVNPGWDVVRSVARLQRLVREVAPDILHATLFRPGVVSRIVGAICRKPVVTTLVNTTYEPEWMLDNPRLSPWKVWAAQMADGVTSRRWGTKFVAVTETVRRSAIRRLGLAPDRIVVIRRGLFIDEASDGPSEDRAAARAGLGWADAFPLILNVGRLVPQKGHTYAIRAMRPIIERYPAARLVIAGDGWLRPELEQVVRAHGLDAHVELLGDRRDVRRLLQATDLFVFPSLYEGAANALLEAMAAGKPCVATDIPSLREVTDDGRVALLAGLRSPEDLAAKLLTVIDDPRLAEHLGHSARTWAHARYDFRISVAALEALYQGLVPAGTGASSGARALT